MTGSDKENAMEKNAPKQCPYCRAAAIGADGKCSDPVCAARPGPTAGNVVEGLGRLKAQMESPAFAAAVFEDTAAATEAARLGAEFGAIAGLAKQGAAAAPLSLERLVRLSVNAGTTVARNHGHISQIEARAWEYAQALLTQAGRAALCREIAARLPAEERERLAAELAPRLTQEERRILRMAVLRGLWTEGVCRCCGCKPAETDGVNPHEDWCDAAKSLAIVERLTLQPAAAPALAPGRGA